MFLAVTFLVAGLSLLTLGAERVVAAAARLSRLWGLSPVLVGALVVGLGTSAPELIVSAIAAARNELDLAVGNVVGSNVSNVTLVLGATALVTPVVTTLGVLRREGLLMLAAVGGLAAALWSLGLARWEAAVLVVAMGLAAAALARWAASYETDDDAASQAAARALATPRREVVFGLAALLATLAGADALIRGAERLAEAASLEASFVGLIIVAVGTSLPELATSLAAARQGETDLIVGNIVGSNLFNSLAVTGMAGLIRPGAIDGAFRPAVVAMLVASTAAAVFVLTGRRLERWEGVILLAGFVAFVALAA